VPSLDITEQAMDAITQRCNDPAATNIKREKPIPLLLWSNRSFFDDNSGQRTEIGARFYFYWTDAAEIEQYRYFQVDTANGGELALAPGELFRSGPHRIDLEGDKLILDESA
jgi:hypothetical protein